MKIGNCKSCDKKKVYLEKDGKCLQCLKEEGDEESVVIMRLDVCKMDYSKAKEYIEYAKSQRGFVRLEHDVHENLESEFICDLDMYDDGLCFYGGPLDGTEYDYKDYDSRSEDRRVVDALVDAYSDILELQFGDWD